ncbi:MAG: hypothetical protein CMJ51_02685 [Planctomycetaceae bacterium]|nr:hypothetical protein [Planctomycetaceae bacterium]
MSFRKLRPLIVSSLVVLLQCSIDSTTTAQTPQDRGSRPGGTASPDGGRPGPGGRQSREGRQAGSDQMAARLMRMDKDQDGKLSREELAESRFAAAFDQADANGDGFISVKEITVFMNNRRPGGGQDSGRNSRPGMQRPEDSSEKTKTPVNPKKAFDDGMSKCGKALRGLRRTKFDAGSFDRDMAATMAMQAGLLAARPYIDAVSMSEAAKVKFGGDEVAYRRSFQKHMVMSLIVSFQLEMAILEGDAEQARELVNQILKDRNESHDLFEN